MNINWEWFVHEYEQINTFLMANVSFIANSIAATLLVLLSRNADKLFRDNVHKHMFVIRTRFSFLSAVWGGNSPPGPWNKASCGFWTRPALSSFCCRF